MCCDDKQEEYIRVITDKTTKSLGVYVCIYDNDGNDVFLVDKDIDVELDVYIAKEYEITTFDYSNYNKVINNILENATINLIESKTILIREMLYEELDDMDFESTGDSYLNIEMRVDEL